MINYTLVSYLEGSRVVPGVLLEGTIYGVAQATHQAADASMLSLLADWSGAQQRIGRLIERALAKGIVGIPAGEAKLVAPLPVPGTLFCAGANYSDHVAEMAVVANIPPDPDPHSLGLRSWHFIKSSRSVIGPGEQIEIPNGSQKLDWEVELAAVVGQKVRNVQVEEALSCVAGYTIAIDLSARDFSRRPGIPVHSPFRFDWMGHKSFDTGCPLGPSITPAEQIADPQNLTIALSVNGSLRQSSNTSRMIFTLAEQISDLSRNLTLWPGDVILTGTPAGVGSATGQFLKSGDQISASIEGIGELRNTVA
jgi:2-keto-4-pentenoate hydratase/2-oxohepta-3-ene-1,7-dioic acid hydratase in catechol pathway